MDLNINFPFPKKVWQAVLLVNTVPEVVGFSLVRDLYSLNNIMIYVLFCALLIYLAWWVERPLKKEPTKKEPTKKRVGRKR